MSVSRLTTAIDDGLIDVPDTGDIVLMRPDAFYDLNALPRDRVRIVQGFYPDASRFESMGFGVQAEADGAATMAVVITPRSKALARHMLAQAAQMVGSGLIVVDGDKVNGIDSLYKDVRKRIGDIPNITKAHGRLFWFAAGADFSDWIVPDTEAGPDGFVTSAGVFSEKKIDKGSELLAAVLPAKLKGHVADFGAGWGYLSRAILKFDKVTSLDVVEAEHRALTCARVNIDDPRAAFHWGDVTTWKGEYLLDHVITNPPFHTSRTGDPELGKAFITAAAARLTPKGNLWLVANRHLPYEQLLNDKFRQVTELKGSSGFKMFCATRPKR